MLWIVLGLILVAIAVLSFTNCINTSTSVNYSEFYSVVKTLGEDGEITKDELEGANAPTIEKFFSGTNYEKLTVKKVVFDGYVVSFTLEAANATKVIGSAPFVTNYSRANAQELENMLSGAGVSFNYTDPNANSIWTSLLPLGGCVLIAIVFFVIMMQTQGGTKSAMNFAKTNARVNHNL